MTITGNHIIQKLVVDVEYNGRVDPLGFENEISEWCRDKLVPYLERYLDGIEFPFHARIDQLDLELTSGEKENWQETLLPEILSRIKTRIDFVKSSAHFEEAAEIKQEKKVIGVSLQSDELHFTRLFLFFLEEGFLPWWSSVPDKNNFQMLLNNWIENCEPAGEEIDLIRKQIASRRSAHRLVTVCDTKQLTRIIKLIFPSNASFIPGVISHLEKAANAVPVNNQQMDSIEFRIAVLQNAHRSRKEFLEVIYMRLYSWFERICNEYDLLQKSFKEVRWKKELHTYASQLLFEFQSKYQIADALLRDHKQNAKAFNDVTTESLNDTAAGKNDQDEKNTEAKSEMPHAGQKEKDPDEREEKTNDRGREIYIPVAGLILIAPLLPTLFKRLSVSDENKIADAPLALLLMHYLVYGNEHAAEFLSPFGKILIGCEIKEPVHPAMQLLPEQREEADELLRSVIEYWKALKDTSIDALRSSFLQRSGKLTRKDDVWHLLVEQKPYDMLLQQLPWSIHMVRLPWMKTVIRTEWIV